MFVFSIDSKDAILLMILPQAFKASEAPVTAKQMKRGRKEESDEKKEERELEQEYFIVHVEVSDAL